MNMSRNAADAPSSAPSNPTDEPRNRSPRRPSPTSSTRRTLPTDPSSISEASPYSNIASHDPLPSSSLSRPDITSPAAVSPEVESGSRRRKREERSSPSVSSSQGDMADTEMEGGSSKPPTSESAPEGPPPKKKRTRTLTTPHQAAVLHALLAQSRFPTTQMREEVGRSIGLSARKVQIWFQNQRQKARRPRGQASTTSAPLTRPPQFGPFTNVPPGSSSDVSPTAPTTAGASEPFFARGLGLAELGYGARAPPSAGSERFPHSHRDRYLAEDYARSGMPPTQLAGPGIPGSSRRPSGGFPFDDPSWNPSSARSHAPFASRPSTAATETLEMYRLTPRPGRPAGEQGPELTLTLPPVMPRSHGVGSSPISPLSAGPYPTLASISALEAGASASARRPSLFDDPRRTLPPPNVDFSSSASSSSSPLRPLNFPPPFTLQPQPQWDDPAFSPFTRRRSPPALPHGIDPPFGDSPPLNVGGATPRSFSFPSSASFRGGGGVGVGETLPSLSTVVPMTAPGHSPIRSPLSPPPRNTRFDPVRSTAGRASHEHPARYGFDDPTDEPEPDR